jgi:hypothetical protein
MKVHTRGIEISESEAISLLNDLYDPDGPGGASAIELWITNAIKGKIHSCETRLVREWTPRLIADPSINQLPASIPAMVNLIAKHPDYKDRQARESVPVEKTVA